MHALLLADSIPVDGLANYGLAGVVLTLLVTFGYMEIKAERSRANGLQKDLDDLNALIRNDYVKGLTTALNAATEQHELVTILRDELRQRPR